MKHIRFLSPAETEMAVAARYYQSQSRGLGRRFLREVERAASAIAAYPHAGAILRNDIRRRLIRGFPFAVLYSTAHDEIVIIAVMDLRRDPDYWITRL